MVSLKSFNTFLIHAFFSLFFFQLLNTIIDGMVNSYEEASSHALVKREPVAVLAGIGPAMPRIDNSDEASQNSYKQVTSDHQPTSTNEPTIVAGVTMLNLIDNVNPEILKKRGTRAQEEVLTKRYLFDHESPKVLKRETKIQKEVLTKPDLFDHEGLKFSTHETKIQKVSAMVYVSEQDLEENISGLGNSYVLCDDCISLGTLKAREMPELDPRDLVVSTLVFHIGNREAQEKPELKPRDLVLSTVVPNNKTTIWSTSVINDTLQLIMPSSLACGLGVSLAVFILFCIFGATKVVNRLRGARNAPEDPERAAAVHRPLRGQARFQRIRQMRRSQNHSGNNGSWTSINTNTIAGLDGGITPRPALPGWWRLGRWVNRSPALPPTDSAPRTTDSGVFRELPSILRSVSYRNENNNITSSEDTVDVSSEHGKRCLADQQKRLPKSMNTQARASARGAADTSNHKTLRQRTKGTVSQQNCDKNFNRKSYGSASSTVRLDTAVALQEKETAERKTLKEEIGYLSNLKEISSKKIRSHVSMIDWHSEVSGYRASGETSASDLSSTVNANRHSEPQGKENKNQADPNDGFTVVEYRKRPKLGQCEPAPEPHSQRICNNNQRFIRDSRKSANAVKSEVVHNKHFSQTWNANMASASCGEAVDPWGGKAASLPILTADRTWTDVVCGRSGKLVVPVPAPPSPKSASSGSQKAASVYNHKSISVQTHKDVSIPTNKPAGVSPWGAIGDGRPKPTVDSEPKKSSSDSSNKTVGFSNYVLYGDHTKKPSIRSDKATGGIKTPTAKQSRFFGSGSSEISPLSNRMVISDIWREDADDHIDNADIVKSGNNGTISELSQSDVVGLRSTEIAAVFNAPIPHEEKGKLMTTLFQAYGYPGDVNLSFTDENSV